MLKNNWHTHTYRCGHARGSDEEFVKAAIKAGIRKLGFSDHAPYPGVRGNGMRMDSLDYDSYVSSINELKEKYKDQIEIYIGLEIEYYERFIDTLNRYRQQLDYLILGQHGFSIEREDSYLITEKKGLLRYCELIEKACDSGLIDCIAHPDICLWSYPQIDETVLEVAARIAEAAKKNDVAVEVNCGSGVTRGKRRYADGERYPYPNKEFFREFARKNCDIIVGLDIHDPFMFETDEYIDKALSVIEGLGCSIQNEYDMIAAAQRRKKAFGITV